MNRLLVPPEELGGSEVVVRGDRHGYLRDVLRLRLGAHIEVFDGTGGVYPSRLSRWVEDGAVLELGPRESRPFAGVRLTLLQGLPKADKFELVVQKAVELGAEAIVPVVTERSVVKLDERKAASRVERWQRIADEAARQCLRADKPAVGEVIKLGDLLQKPPQPGEHRLVLDEEERGRRLRETLGDPAGRYLVLVGPEGGLTREEVAASKSAGFTAVTLGPRILRTETVGLAVLSIVQHVLGDLG